VHSVCTVTVAFRGLTRTVFRGAAAMDPILPAALAAVYLAIAMIAMCVPVARTLRAIDPAGALREG
jgi:hypothetical protein